MGSRFFSHIFRVDCTTDRSGLKISPSRVTFLHHHDVTVRVDVRLYQHPSPDLGVGRKQLDDDAHHHLRFFSERSHSMWTLINHQLATSPNTVQCKDKKIRHYASYRASSFSSSDRFGKVVEINPVRSKRSNSGASGTASSFRAKHISLHPKHGNLYARNAAPCPFDHSRDCCSNE